MGKTIVGKLQEIDRYNMWLTDNKYKKISF